MAAVNVLSATSALGLICIQCARFDKLHPMTTVSVQHEQSSSSSTER